MMSDTDPEGGAGGARPPLFGPISLKSPLNWPKKSCGPRTPCLRPLLFQILDLPLKESSIIALFIKFQLKLRVLAVVMLLFACCC